MLELARHMMLLHSRIATGAGRQTYREAEHRRTTEAQVASLDRAPAPRHPALRFSGIVREFLRLRLAQAAFDRELVGLANPAIDCRRIPKSGRQGGGFGLIVGVDLTRGGLDLERVERASACRQPFHSDHFGLAIDAHRGAALKACGLAIEAPVLADPERHFDASSIGRCVLPKAVVDAAPAAIENNLSRACSPN